MARSQLFPHSGAAQETSSVETGEGGATHSGPRVDHFRLDNGMDVVVIPDHRAPVVTHTVWYRNGSADDPRGKSGIAHFLEHLMFKGTNAHKQGEFSHLVAELGGQENAFTSYDFTAYFQRVAREHLKTMMEFEADRMTGLNLTDEVVAPERDVVMEERRMRTEADPAAQLDEALNAALYTHHSYGVPIIGWGHEIETLDRQDALAYYRRFYTPENAILVVAGDVEAPEVEMLARETYGKIPARGEAPQRHRPREPEPRAERIVRLADAKVEQPQFERIYLVPSAHTAEKGEAEALDVLAHHLGGGQTSLLFRRLVLERKIAVSAGAYYYSDAVDESRFYVYALPAEGVSLDELERGVDAVLEESRRDGVSGEDVARAATRLVADAVYAQDNQTSLARWFGAALANGGTIDDVLGWSARIEAVSVEDVAKAMKWLNKRRAVSGFLLKDQAAA
ncbi:insulinase family protein [Rhodoblastus acidophilus]|uniref:Insulinase family protein n=1 Tax=Candidatus Rhodoblastus alkanivorans TaxID=2954117 RepID=A0ABS9Z492_9HYPH|nr:pitrilysin family protein [Candidatus Rhodoblastus alkanivorans]MCI4680579.1 insulinase family protein [Candidatus Rhodoblastus alkanivorans]MCI4682498.1 insulinase family protein [Candidatus Rhodoblastus alkanivorans]MDI4639804.1 insulinase family protein [Rhodoblastus acidophilus]